MVKVEDKGRIMLDTAWRYFWKHCPDPLAYFEDWTEDERNDAYVEAVGRI